MDCFQDFCVACDKQSTGTYCSQACRLADLERGTASPPTSPHSSQVRNSWPSTTTAGSAYVLSPAVDFHASEQQIQTCYFMRYPSQQQSDETHQQRSLTPSSSRSSLSSTTSVSTCTGGISQQARHELDGFFSSFSRAKAAKRRSSLR